MRTGHTVNFESRFPGMDRFPPSYLDDPLDEEIEMKGYCGHCGELQVAGEIQVCEMCEGEVCTECATLEDGKYYCEPCSDERKGNF